MNRPALDALAYRVGTHGSFLATMLSRLSGPDSPPLHALAARSGDAAIALLDAWAVVGDILAFYQERIANEGFLRTATERRSLLEVARLIGYELRPGVAASTYLAYTVDKDLSGNDTVLTIAKGSRAQSVPGPDELPQAFETSDPVVAGSAWTDLKPRMWRPARFSLDEALLLEALYFEGVSTGLKVGDVILLVFGDAVDHQVPLKVKLVTPEQIVPVPPGPPISRTVVTLQQAERAALNSLLAALARTEARRKQLGSSKVASNLKVDILDPLKQLGKNAPQLSAIDVAAGVAEKLQILKETLALAEASGKKGAADWTRDTIAGLEPPLQRLIGLVGPLPPPAATGASSPAVAHVGRLLPSLQLRPAAQPATTLQLARSTARLFGEGSDLGSRLLATFRPELRGSLYRALAGSPTQAPTLRSAQAMRVKAAPFGATAPLKPVLDARGAVVGSEEWPLDGTVSLEMRLLPRESRMELAAVTEGMRSIADVDMTPPIESSLSTTADLPPGKAEIGMDETTIKVTFTSGLPSVVFVVSLDDGRPKVTIETQGEEVVFHPRPNQVLSHSEDGFRVGVALAEREGLEITVTDEVFAPPSPKNVLTLDSQYDEIVPGSWVVIERKTDTEGPVLAAGTPAGQPTIAQVVSASTVAKAAYGLSAKVTELTLSRDWLRDDDVLLSAIRTATVYAQSEPLELAPEPIDDDVSGDTIELGELYEGLETGRSIIVEGERTDVADATGVTAAEPAMIAGVLQGADPTLAGDETHTTLLLARALTYSYKRSSVKVWGNVVRATHGESKAEIFGSGDATKAFQTFALRSAPLTYLASSNALGAQSTLEVRVDDVLWHEADSLAFLGPADRRYVLRADENDKPSVLFGDGRRGARPATGIENVRGEYRIGVGRPGNVKARQISQLQTRPLGVSAVINPLAATGGADRDSLEQVRRNAPVAVKALDRLVSVRDYEDFAKARAGIGKASARALSDGVRRVVHLTIAGSDDIPIDTSSDLFTELRASLAVSGDPSQAVEVALRELILIVISARVEVHPDYRWGDVEPKVRAKLLDRFGFDRRELGQPVFLSEVQSAVQSVPGVTSVDVDVLAGVPGSITPSELAELSTTLQQPPPSAIPVDLACFERKTYKVEASDTLTGIAAANGIGLGELVRLNPGLPSAHLPLAVGTELVVRRGIRPAQLALLSPSIPDSLILQEAKP